MREMMKKEGKIGLLLILFFVGFLFLVYNNFVVALDPPTNVTSEIIPHHWIRDTQINSVVYDSNNSLLYFVGSSGLFGFYNLSSNVTTDLNETDIGNWIGTSSLLEATYDSNKDLVYFSGASGVFGYYNRSANKTTDLRAVDTGNWISTGTLRGLSYDSNYNLVYFAGDTGIFGYYNRTSNTTTDLRAVDTGDWITTYTLMGLTYDSNFDLVYFGGQWTQKIIFGYYNRTANTIEKINNLSSTGGWFEVYSPTDLTYDPNSKLIYFVGNERNIFGIYNRTSNITERLNQTTPSSWDGAFNDITFDPNNNLVYLSATNEFGYYNRSSNTTTDLSATDNDLYSGSDWIGSSYVYGLTFDNRNNLTYLAGSDGVFGYYNQSSNITLDLNLPNDFVRYRDIHSLIYTSNKSLVYIGGESAAWGSYNRTSNTKEDLRGTDPEDWMGNSQNPEDLAYDSQRNLVYVISRSRIGAYNHTSNVTVDLNGTDTGDWIAASDSINRLTYDSNQDSVYLGGGLGIFGIYNRTSNITEDLRITDPGDWIASTSIESITYDTEKNLVYIGGGAGGGMFGVYNRTLNSTEDLRTTDIGNWISGSYIYDMVYNPDNDLVYLGGSSSIFGFYNRTSNVTYDLRATDSGNWMSNSFTIESMVYDNKNLIYIAGSTGFIGLFGVYNLTSNTTENLNGTDANNWFGSSYIYALAYDNQNDLIYLGGQGGLFGVYNRTSNSTEIVAITSNTTTTTTSSGGGSAAILAGVTTISIQEITPEETAIIDVSNSYSSLTTIKINSKTTITEVKLNITKVNISEADFQVVAGGKNGETYEAYNIEFTGNNSDLENVTIEFKVNKSWLDLSGFDILNLALYRKPTDNTKWRTLDTTYLSLDSLYYYFSAVSPGFSTFLIFVGENECNPGEKRCFENEVQFCLGNKKWLVSEVCDYKCVNGKCVEKGLQINLNPLVVYPIIGIVVVGVLVSFLAQRMPQKRKGRKR